MDTDKIEKQILLQAPQKKVWRALSDAKQFGSWFGAKFDAPFEPGAKVHGAIMPTTVDPKVAKMQESHKGTPIKIEIEDTYRERLFSFRWHPYAIEVNRDYSTEPMTLVEFSLEPAANGVWLTVTESGFDRLPTERREKARAANETGWEKQVHLIEAYLSRGKEAATSSGRGLLS